MRLVRSILTLALVAGGVFATAGTSKAGFSVSVTITSGGSGTTTGSSGLNADTLTVNGATTDGTLAATFQVANSVGTSLDLNLVTFVYNLTGPATVASISATITIRTNDISYLDGLGTFRQTNSIGAATGGSNFTVSSTTGNQPSSPLATIAGTSGTTTFPSTGGGPRYIERTYLVTIFNGEAIFFNDVGGSNVADVSVVTPAPMSLVAALGCVPVLGFVGMLRRRKLKEVAAA